MGEAVVETDAGYLVDFDGDEAVGDGYEEGVFVGGDSVTPFLEAPLPTSPEGKEKQRQHWVILLALTSNKGSQDFQLAPLLTSPEGEETTGERLFERVLRISQQWANEDQMMYVVGATQGRAFEDIRKIVPNHFLLVPGIGAQGGSLEEVCRYGMTKDCGLIVNSSRAIIYASNGEDFALRAGEEAHKVQQQMAKEIEKLRK